MTAFPNQQDDDAIEPFRELARKLLDRLWGDDAHLDWSRIEGHEVWRVRQVETGATVVVKSGANVATAHAMADSGVAPQVLAADDATGICVMEDLGDTTLADILAAADPDTAAQGLVDLAGALGRLHGWSVPLPSHSRLPTVPPLPLAAFMNICGALGVDAGRARSDLIEAERCMRSEDPQVVIHGDACPDNYVPGVSTRDTGKFVDFEEVRRANAILEAACWHMPFPTCWRVARLPVDLLPRMDATYLAAFGVQRQQVLDHATFQRLLAAACVYWLVLCLTGKRFVEAEDDRFAGDGCASVRQRGLLWLDSAAAAIAEAGQFEAAGDVAGELRKRLRHRWEPFSDAPCYPAFMPRH